MTFNAHYVYDSLSVYVLVSYPAKWPRMFIFDAHLDLGMNALEWNRDLARPIDEIRAAESGMTDKLDRGLNTVCLAEMRRGRIGVCVATMLARYTRPGEQLPGWPKNLVPGWRSPEIAWAVTQGQLSWYRAMEAAGQLRQITDLAGLENQLQSWNADDPNAAAPTEEPIGYILSLEGADSIRSITDLEFAYSQGLRAIGPAHYGPGRYAQGTHASGGLTPAGRELLAEMDRLGIILDATHLCDESFWEALEIFQGPVWASHNNCREIVPGVRQFSDDQLRALIARGAVIGAVLDTWMLIPGWVRGQSTPAATGVTLAHSVEHVDHICQLAGNTNHIGIGSDLDGGFGREQSPLDVDTIADLTKYEQLLQARGYSPLDMKKFFHQNWVEFLRNAWKAA
jgi:membrane dipeptidase